MRWRTRLAVSGFSLQIGCSTPSTSAVSIACTSRSPSFGIGKVARVFSHCHACLALRQPLPLALDQRLGRGLERQHLRRSSRGLGLGCPTRGQGIDLLDLERAPVLERRLPRLGQRDLRVWPETHVAAHALVLVAEHPRAPAGGLDQQRETSNRPVHVPAGRGRPHRAIRQLDHVGATATVTTSNMD